MNRMYVSITVFVYKYIYIYIIYIIYVYIYNIYIYILHAIYEKISQYLIPIHFYIKILV